MATLIAGGTAGLNVVPETYSCAFNHFSVSASMPLARRTNDSNHTFVAAVMATVEYSR